MFEWNQKWSCIGDFWGIIFFSIFTLIGEYHISYHSSNLSFVLHYIKFIVCWSWIMLYTMCLHLKIFVLLTLPPERFFSFAIFNYACTCMIFYQLLPATFGKSRSFSTASKSEPLTQSKGRYMVTLIPGDGVGPELVHSVKRVFRYGPWINIV